MPSLDPHVQGCAPRGHPGRVGDGLGGRTVAAAAPLAVAGKDRALTPGKDAPGPPAQARRGPPGQKRYGQQPGKAEARRLPAPG
ncbi:uncharacterized protein LOC119051194 isoform X2 [Artibeus jamaicensis]|uniref:uncharacterized protein LOC119051194 isoform X2 n=1 Tax=Artibeus jamaicensis TaxID=9417 RepID=UPI00235AA3F0|nr:uncharacterized protein LOC119051194 isoform X2 [Artibeus jamaicensis]